ncbi:MAG: hypothetical protein AAGG01_04475 [Planctomycetota bacterium]
MAAPFEPQDPPASDLAAHTLASIKELRKKRLVQWCIRSAITGTLLWWLSTQWSWVRIVFYAWAVIAVLSLLVLLFLPSIVENRIRAMEQRMTEGLDLAGMAPAGFPGTAPRDVSVDEVRDGHGGTSALPTGPVPLEVQLRELESFGIYLAEGVTLDDLTYSVPREELEAQPYQMLIHHLGVEVEREPWGRPFSGRIWSFDAECIESDGSYVDIVKSIARISGKSDALGDLTDSVDVGQGKAALSYSIDGVPRSFRPEITDDWADPATVQAIAQDFSDINRGLYGIPEGQVTTIVSLQREHFDQFQSLLTEELIELA